MPGGSTASHRGSSAEDRIEPFPKLDAIKQSFSSYTFTWDLVISKAVEQRNRRKRESTLLAHMLVFQGEIDVFQMLNLKDAFPARASKSLYT